MLSLPRDLRLPAGRQGKEFNPVQIWQVLLIKPTSMIYPFCLLILSLPRDQRDLRLPAGRQGLGIRLRIPK